MTIYLLLNNYYKTFWVQNNLLVEIKKKFSWDRRDGSVGLEHLLLSPRTMVKFQNPYGGLQSSELQDPVPLFSVIRYQHVCGKRHTCQTLIYTK